MDVSVTRLHLPEVLARRVTSTTRAALGDAAVQATIARVLDGVFDANLQVSRDQMTAYAELLRAVAEGLDTFITPNDEDDGDGD